MPGLLRRSRTELPGLTGVARVDRRTDALMRRLKPGDIAVLDQVDLDHATADALVAAGVGGGGQRRAVDLRPLPEPRARRCWSRPASRWSTGSARRSLRHDQGRQPDPGARAARSTSARCAGRGRRADAGVGGRRDGGGQVRAGPPARGVRRQHHRVHAPGAVDAARRRRRARRRGRAHGPAGAGRGGRLRPRGRPARLQVLHPGVPPGAGRRRRRRRRAAGRRPPPRSDRRRPGRGLQRGADLRRRRRRARPSRTATRPGLHRVQDLGAGAVTFPSSANPEDLALLLAAHHGAALVVTVGLSATHGRVPRPRPVGQQRLDVPDPAAGRRTAGGRPHDRRALPQPAVHRRDPADAGARCWSPWSPRCWSRTPATRVLAWFEPAGRLVEQIEGWFRS